MIDSSNVRSTLTGHPGTPPGQIRPPGTPGHRPVKSGRPIPCGHLTGTPGHRGPPPDGRTDFRSDFGLVTRGSRAASPRPHARTHDTKPKPISRWGVSVPLRSHHPNLRYHIISYHTIPYRTVPYRIVSYRIVSYRIVSYRTISYHIIS